MVKNALGIDFLKKTSLQPLPPDNDKQHFFLVVPASPQIPTPGREFFLKAPTAGVSYISTTLKNAGYNVGIIDYRTQNEDFFLKDIPQHDKIIIGIATFVDSYIFLEDFIRKIKEKNKEIYIVLGGSFISSAPEVLMKNLAADYAVIGEGELTILELMDALSKADKRIIPQIPGICYKEDGKVFFTRPRQQILCLDYLPLPDFSLWPTIKQNPRFEKLGFSSSRFRHPLFSGFSHQSYRNYRRKSSIRGNLMLIFCNLSSTRFNLASNPSALSFAISLL